MSVFLFIVGAVFLLAGVFILLSSLGVLFSAQSAMHQIYAAEMAGNAILLLGFGFLLFGVAHIINQNNAARQAQPHTNTEEAGAFDDARINKTGAVSKQEQSGNNRQNDDAADLQWSELFWAANHGRLDITNALIQGGANVNAWDTFGLCPLHWAAKRGHIDIADALIKAGANVNAKANSGKTPLYIAAQEDKADMVAALIKAGADLHIFSNYYKTPLQIAEQNGNDKTAELLRNAAATQDESTAAKVRRSLE